MLQPMGLQRVGHDLATELKTTLEEAKNYCGRKESTGEMAEETDTVF